MRYTFNHLQKKYPTSHEHVTLDFRDDGSLWALTREKKRSVGARWVRCGRWTKVPRRIVEFYRDCEAYSLAATKLARMGWLVIGARRTGWGRIEVLECIQAPGGNWITNPDSIRGNIRSRSSNLGKVPKGERGVSRFGTRGHADVEAMRRAIEARRKV